eukprot:1594768-Amphidinium_carterae.1
MTCIHAVLSRVTIARRCALFMDAVWYRMSSLRGTDPANLMSMTIDDHHAENQIAQIGFSICSDSVTRCWCNLIKVAESLGISERKQTQDEKMSTPLAVVSTVGIASGLEGGMCKPLCLVI